MMKRTHLAIGLAITIPVILKSDFSVMSGCGLIGAIAPDWDYYIGLEHRTSTHSLVTLVLSTIPLYLYSHELGIIWGLCYLSHIIADCLTVMGVPFLHPFIKKKYGLKLFYTGGGEDYFIQLLAIYFSAINFI